MKNRPFLLAAVIAVSGLGLTACSSGQSASDVLTLTNNQLSIQNAVSFVDATTIGTSLRTVTGFVGPIDSQETLTADGSPILQVRLLSTTAYVYSSSSSVLVSALGLSMTKAQSVTNTWIKVVQGDAPFANIVSSLSVSSSVSTYVPPSKGVHFGPERAFKGVKTYQLTGTTSPSSSSSAEVSLFVNEKTYLPVAGTVLEKTGTNTVRKEAVFRNWGKQVTVATPPSSIPYASLVS